MPADTQAALLVRVGGNPLFAEQYVRMLAERRGEDEPTLPETLQGIIAARLDALLPEEKALLQDASVLGKAFWVGALSAAARDLRRRAPRRSHARAARGVHDARAAAMRA